MNKKNFESLKRSLIEAGKIMRGEMPPSREFTFEVDPSQFPAKVAGFAVCVETDDPELLIPHKIYSVTFHGDKYVSFRDEEGEKAVYPAEFFVKIDLPAEVESRLQSAA